MKKSELVDALNYSISYTYNNEYYPEGSQPRYVFDRLSHDFKDKFYDIFNRVVNKYREEWLSHFQFRNNDLEVVSISEVPENVLDKLDKLFKKFDNQIGGIFEFVVDKAVTDIFKPLNDLMFDPEKSCDKNFKITPYHLNKLPKSELEKIYNELQENVEKFNKSVYSILDVLEDLIDADYKKAMSKFDGCHYVIYPWRENIFQGIVGEVYNDDIYFGWMDNKLDRTPEDYKRDVGAKERYNDVVSAHYDRIGKCDF